MLESLIFEPWFMAIGGLRGLMTVVLGSRAAKVGVNADRSGRRVLTPGPPRHICQLCCEKNPGLAMSFERVTAPPMWVLSNMEVFSVAFSELFQWKKNNFKNKNINTPVCPIITVLQFCRIIC